MSGKTMKFGQNMAKMHGYWLTMKLQCIQNKIITNLICSAPKLL